MRILVVALVIAVIFAIGYFMGRSATPKLSSEQTKELKNLRSFKHDVIADATQHLMLDSPLATIIMDRAQTYSNKELE